MSMTVVFDHGDEEMGPDVIDGMSLWQAEDEVDGIDSEFAWDAAVEDSPFPDYDDIRNNRVDFSKERKGRKA